MRPAPRAAPVRGRGIATLAIAAALTIFTSLSRKGRFAMSIATPETAPQRPSAPGARETASTIHHTRRHGDTAPGEPKSVDVWASIRTYLIGFVLAGILTAGSFVISSTDLIYGPGVPVALIVFAIAQVGVHLVFFLHLTTAPDNINNALALAFGVLIVLVLIAGTIWIMSHMNANMMPMGSAPHGSM